MMDFQSIEKMMTCISRGECVNKDVIYESINYAFDNKDCRLATRLAYCFGKTNGDNYAWALEKLLRFDFCPQATAQAIKFLCRKGLFEQYRDLILKWAAVAPSRANNTSQKMMAISMVGEHLRERKDKCLRDFIASKVEHYLSFDEDELLTDESSEKHRFEHAAADAMGADMEEILLCDDIDHSDRLVEYWVKRFLKERTDG